MGCFMQDLSSVRHWCSCVDFFGEGGGAGNVEQKAVHVVKGSNMCGCHPSLENSRSDKEGGGDRLTGCFQPTSASSKAFHCE